jgi:3',5'-nucleoside bisphosphate phosphatase
MKIDLHIHSTASDGALSPKELINTAIKMKIKAMAITDHDSIDGLKEAVDYSRGKDIEFVPGIEFSANPKGLAKEIHVVGIFIDYSHKAIVSLLKKQEESRISSINKMIKKLNELGYDITYEESKKEAGKEKFGRPTLAKVLLRKYSFKDKKQVFDELLGSETGKAFFMYESSSMEEIIKAIHACRGIAILAHPAYLYKNANKVIDEFVSFGGDGIEVDCAYAEFKEAKDLKKRFKDIAKEKNLIVSGGTDFHSEKESPAIGSFGVTKNEFQKIKDFLKKD